MGTIKGQSPGKSIGFTRVWPGVGPAAAAPHDAVPAVRGSQAAGAQVAAMDFSAHVFQPAETKVLSEEVGCNTLAIEERCKEERIDRNYVTLGRGPMLVWCSSSFLKGLQKPTTLGSKLKSERAPVALLRLGL